MERTVYVTTFWRALLAIVGGPVVGGLVFLLEIAILLALRPAKLGEMTEYLGMGAFDFIQILVLAVFVFFIGGLLLVGTPVWYLLHRMGRRQWFYAVAVGAVLAAAGFVLMVLWNPEWPALSLVSFLTEEFGGLTARDGQLTGEGWSALVRGTIGLALAGGLAGLSLWKIAYRRRRPAAAAPLTL
jgi:hypothetical protein